MKHPSLVWITLVLSVITLLLAAFGFLHMLVTMMGQVHVPDRAVFNMLVQLAFSIYLGFVVYAVIRRPLWGRGICISFSLVLLLIFLLSASITNHIVGHLAGSVLRTRMRIANVLLVGACVLYAYMLAIGSRAFRHYFVPPPEPDPEPDSIPRDTPSASTATPSVTPAPAGTPPDPAAPNPPSEPGEIRLSFD